MLGYGSKWGVAVLKLVINFMLCYGSKWGVAVLELLLLILCYVMVLGCCGT